MDDDLNFITRLNQIELGDENNSSIDGNEITTESVYTVSSDLPYDVWLSETDQYIQSYSKIKLDYAKTNEKYQRFLLADYFAQIKIEENLEDKVSKSGRRVRLSTGMSISVDSVSSAGESEQSIDESEDLLENTFLPETTSVRNVSYPFLGDGENKIFNAYVDDIRTVGYGRKEDLHCLSYNNSFDPRLTFEGLFNNNKNEYSEGDVNPTMSEEELAQNVFLSFDDPDPIVEKYLNCYRKLLQDLNGNQTEKHVTVVSRTPKPSTVDLLVTDDGTSECKQLFQRINSNSIKKLWNSTDNNTFLGSTDLPARGDDRLSYKNDEVEGQKQIEIINEPFSKSEMNNDPQTNSNPYEEVKEVTDKKAEEGIARTKISKQKHQWHASWWNISTEDEADSSGYNKYRDENERNSQMDERKEVKDSRTWDIPNTKCVSRNTTTGNLVSLKDPKRWQFLTKSDDPLKKQNTSDTSNTKSLNKSVNWAKFFKNSEKDPKETKEAPAESKKASVCSEEPETTMNVTLSSKPYPTTKSFQPSMAKDPQDFKEETIPPDHHNVLYTRPSTTQYPANKINDPQMGWMKGSPSINTMRVDQAKQDVYNKQTTPRSTSVKDFGSKSGINLQPTGNAYQNAVAYRLPSQNPSLNVVPLPAGFNNIAPPLDRVNMSYQPLSQPQQHLFHIQHPHASVGTQQQSCYDPCTVTPFQLGLLPNASNTISTRYGHQQPHLQPSTQPQQLRNPTQNQYHFQGSQQHHNIQQYNNNNYQQQLMAQNLFRFKFNQVMKHSTVMPASNWTFNLNNNSTFNNNNNNNNTNDLDDNNVFDCSVQAQHNSNSENIPSIIHSDQRKESSIKDKIKVARHRQNRSNLVRIYPKSDIKIL